jgi:hypothetical protein
MKSPYVGMRPLIEFFDFDSVEEFEALCYLVVESEREAGQQAQMMDLGTPAESNMVLL